MCWWTAVVTVSTFLNSHIPYQWHDNPQSFHRNAEFPAAGLHSAMQCNQMYFTRLSPILTPHKGLLQLTRLCVAHNRRAVYHAIRLSNCDRSKGSFTPGARQGVFCLRKDPGQGCLFFTPQAILGIVARQLHANILWSLVANPRNTRTPSGELLESLLLTAD